ncbi:MAG TPA: SUMF1/EgtB/PvdO family nonheme iron enzyme [Candidatus Wunengus sp. YC63]|uniref:SUMF1/EgtB/PvdO family nonheme iron enzyme n=1 Tax=Candidatus Wunengus sp. YC63 TaxID=3367699 RepID=UPI004029FF09
MSTFQILHISDLHISTKEVFDTSIILDPFFERLDEDKRESGLAPEIVVVTGDVACNGDEREYDLAKKYFDRLLSELSLSPDRLFIVPGNHDLKRTKLKTTLNIQTMRDVNGLLEDQETRGELLKDLEKYFLFIENNYKHLKGNHGRLVPFVKNYRAACGKQIGLVGVNSAWVGKKSPFGDKMIIADYQMEKTKEELVGAGDVDIIINIFHHPLDYLWEISRSICMKYFNNTILLTGHFHGNVEAEFHDDLRGSYHQFKAGGLYLGSESEHPNRFQYITFDWDKNEIRLNFRKFVKEDRKWCPESERGADGVQRFSLPIRKGDVRDIHPEVIPGIPDSYKNWISVRCENMDIDKLVDSKDKDLINLTLPKIFIPLYAAPPGEKTKRKQREIEEGQHAVDIETLIAKNDYLLISGQAGSGKTTLLKYLAYTIANEENKAGLNGFLPVLVFLRDLPQMKKKPANHISGTGAAEKLLSDYFQTIKHGLTIELVKAYCKEKRAIFLIDGLDEIEPELRKTVVESLATLRADYHCKMALSGRPHGIDTAVNNQFGKKLVEINPLNLDQVTLFIEKWYSFDQELQAKGKTPTVMFGEIKDHPNVEKLITTPLMLTAACVLYHYDKKLPEQRADLYEKVISNLIHKRFSNPAEVLKFLMELAYKVHTTKQRKLDENFDASKIGFDKALALRVMETVFEREKDETKTQHELRLIKEFDNIEQDCGLLRLEDGQYRFWHLTFQEFLMAREIAMFERDHAKVINKKYWDNDWFKEMIELLIGHLSNTANAIANGIVEDKLLSHDSSPFRNWRLACNCLLDIHPGMRDSKVVKLAQERLRSIFEQKLEQDPKILAEVGEILGWLGDPRDLKKFVKIEGEEYDLEGLGKVNITPFEICKYPVTNQWYKEFIDAKGYEKSEYWGPHGWEWLKRQQVEFPLYWHERIWKSPNSPVVGICWYEAYAFCRWLTEAKNDGYTYQLPTEQEWQAAAAGKNGREYAWGKGFDGNKCNASESKIGRTSAVGIFVEGNTPEGIADLSGNVWEWTKTQYDTKNSANDFIIDKNWDKGLALRGGSWISEGSGCRCACRSGVVPDYRGDIGFRCARTLKL